MNIFTSASWECSSHYKCFSTWMGQDYSYHILGDEHP